MLLIVSTRLSTYIGRILDIALRGRDVARTAGRTGILGSRTARARLARRSKPYFVEIVPGKLRLGWRATSSAWIGSFYQGDGKYEDKALGAKADDVLDPDGAGIITFAQAQERL